MSSVSTQVPAATWLQRMLLFRTRQKWGRPKEALRAWDDPGLLSQLELLSHSKNDVARDHAKHIASKIDSYRKESGSRVGRSSAS